MKVFVGFKLAVYNSEKFSSDFGRDNRWVLNKFFSKRRCVYHDEDERLLLPTR